MNKAWFYLTTAWRSILLTALAAASILILLSFRLGSLTPGFHSLELASHTTASSFQSLVKAPINAPYYVVRNTIQHFRPALGIKADRLTSAAFAFAVVLAFYGLLRQWYRQRVAALGTILLATSSWFLRNGRLGVPDIGQALLIVLVYLLVWSQTTKLRKTATLLITITLALLLYIPGLVWIILIGLVWQRKSLLQEIRKLPNLIILGYSVITLLLIAPLLAGLIRQPHLIRQLAGVSSTLNPLDYIKNLAHVPIKLFLQGSRDSLLFVGRKPLLDIFTSVMIVIGLYNSLLDRQLDRNKLTLGFLVLGCAISALSTTSLLTLLLLPLFLLATSGIAYLLDEWFRVFPRNPLAKSIATIMISTGLLVTVIYHTTNYFVAWPHTPATKAAFTRRI